jgi:cytochrome c biogenesis protein CcdA
MTAIYFITATALVFVACLIGAKKIRKRLKPKRVLLIALISVIVVVLIWVFVAVMSREREKQEQPGDYSAGTAASRSCGSGAV